MPTHRVENQPPPLVDYNLFAADRVLTEALERDAVATHEILALGELAGRAETIELGFDANEHLPELHTHDRFGNRTDEVRFHPAWHALMHTATEFGLHAAPWRDRVPNPHLRRAVKFFIWSQVESGHGCPISMTYAAVPAIDVQPEIAAAWTPVLAARAYEPRLLPIDEKRSALCGMGMTEKQGGSDVRANTTSAIPAGQSGPGREYLLRGHKWFCSAPMCDAFLMLAQTQAGVSCFFVPRILTGGTRNPFFIQRLKHKLGNRSNASSEIELDGMHGWLVGEEGRGVRAIAEMVNHTRLDCVIGSAALMRQALVQALHHATYRKTFGRRLVDHPLMQNVLADLALETEASTAIFLRLARAVDASPIDPHSAALKRIGTAIGKYYVCKRAPLVTAEALECLGGNGYVEASIMPRLYREAPVNSVWEGPANIQALDVLRILRKQPDALEALRIEIAPALDEPRVAARAAQLEAEIRDESHAEARARSIAERMALLWQASLLLQHAPSAVSDAFVAGRLDDSRQTLGTLLPGTDFEAIIERASPREKVPA